VITGNQKQEYLDMFNAVLGLNLDLADLKMLTDIDAHGKPLAVVGFFNSSQYNLEMSIASVTGWTGTRFFAKACFDYAFNRCGAMRITCYARESNVKSIYFQTRLGFKREFSGVLKHWFGKEDGVQFFMLKKNCKWLKETKKC